MHDLPGGGEGGGYSHCDLYTLHDRNLLKSTLNKESDPWLKWHCSKNVTCVCFDILNWDFLLVLKNSLNTDHVFYFTTLSNCSCSDELPTLLAYSAYQFCYLFFPDFSCFWYLKCGTHVSRLNMKKNTLITCFCSCTWCTGVQVTMEWPPQMICIHRLVLGIGTPWKLYFAIHERNFMWNYTRPVWDEK